MLDLLTPLGKFLRNNEDFRKKSLHKDTEMTLIQFTASMLSIYVNHGISESAIDELLNIFGQVFGSLVTDMFPKTFRELKSIINEFLVHHKMYEACAEGHTLYKGIHKDASCCPVVSCKASRDEAQKYYYIPMIPRMKQLFEVQKYAQELQSHNQSDDGLMRDIHDSPTWVNLFYKESGDYYKNKSAMMLLVSSDGYQPFHHCTKTSNYSIWVFQCEIANLPFHLREKLMIINGVTEGKLHLNHYHPPVLSRLLLL